MSNSNPEWICCQLGAREHYAVARALHRCDALKLLLTDAWVSPRNPLARLKPGLRARFHPDLATANVCAMNLDSIAFELRARLAGLRNWPRMIARNEWFQKMAVARLSRIPACNTPCTLMAYSYAALEILRYARGRNWRTVLGQIDAGPMEERIVTRLHDENQVHCGSWERPPERYWAHWHAECTLADHIVVNSVWSKSALVDVGVPAEKIRVVPLAYEGPVTVGSFRRDYPAAFTASRPLRVLFLGLVNLRKGMVPLLDAIRLLRGAPVEFWFVGSMQMCVPPDLRHDRQVRWFGEVPHEDTAWFYREADLFLFPTFSDGFGLTQLEAQAWRLPIVATRFCGEVVSDGSNGWLLSELTAGAIAATVRRCLADPARLEELSAKAVCGEQFGLDRVGEQWLHVFE